MKKRCYKAMLIFTSETVLTNLNLFGVYSMRRVIYSLALSIALALTTSAADSANKIIDRYKKASGGDAFKKIKNTIITGNVKTNDGQQGRFAEQTAIPDRLRTDLEVGALKISQCYNGKSAWRMDMAGLRTLLGAEAKQLRLGALLAAGKLRELSRNRIYPQAPVKTLLDGRAALAIEFTREEAKVKLYFDAKTNLIIKQEREAAAGLEEIFYSDYRAVEKVMQPFAIKIKNGASELSIAVEKIEYNRAADEAAFRYPQTESAKPLPDVETLMKAVVANQEKIETLREKYTFKQTETENKLDGDGRIKKSEVRVSEITPVAGRFVERLISVNGKPLSEKELAEEDKRVQKEIEKILERREKKLKEKEKKKDEDEEEDEDRTTILKILRVSDITSMRREIFRGHEVVAFDFEPRKGFKPKSRLESLLNKLAGTMWIDEPAEQIVRLEARLTDSFKFAGGLLASISPSTAFAFDQEKVGDELWMPSYAEVNVGARALLFMKFNANIVTRYSDYKKYSIDDKYELQKPKEAKPEEKQVKNE